MVAGRIAGRGAVPLVAVVLAFACRQAPPPLLPTGIADMRLDIDQTGLRRIAERDQAAGTLAGRHSLLTDLNRQVLMAPPDDAVVPELFDLVTAMAPRMASGAISPAWASYVYTSHQQNLVRDRGPRRSPAELERVLDDYVEYFHLQAGSKRLPTAEDAAFEEMRAWRRDGGRW